MLSFFSGLWHNGFPPQCNLTLGLLSIILYNHVRSFCQTVMKRIVSPTRMKILFQFLLSLNLKLESINIAAKTAPRFIGKTHSILPPQTGMAS